MSTIDLSQLPLPDVIESLDFETILAERKAKLVSLFPAEQQAAIAATLALESEPLNKFLQESSYRELTLRQRINEAARAVMLPFSKGKDLDNLAANNEVKRLVVVKGDPDATPPIADVYEPDESLCLRTQESFEGLSVAGPRLAYAYHARSADGRIADVSATTPAPCEIVVTVLSREGNGSASAEILANVTAALSDEDIRPLGDLVTVQSAEIIDYQIEASIWIYPGPEAEAILTAARQRLQDYASDQRRLGRDIRRSAITGVLYVSGVQRIEIIKPAVDLILTPAQSARCTNWAVNLGGTDE